MDPTDTDLMLPNYLQTEVSNVMCKKKQSEVCGDYDNHRSCTIGGLIESKLEMVCIRCSVNSRFSMKKNKEMIELTLTETTHSNFLILPACTVVLNIFCVYCCHDLWHLSPCHDLQLRHMMTFSITALPRAEYCLILTSWCMT